MLRHCIDAGITSQLLDCDHCAIFLKLRVMRRLKRKNWTTPTHVKCRSSAKLSDVIFDEQSYIPIADHFKYLGSLISLRRY